VRLSPDELSVLMAGLRVASVVYHQKSIDMHNQMRYAEEAQQAAFAIECARLAEAFEKEGHRQAPTLTIIR
jgi:hypothetical protein